LILHQHALFNRDYSTSAAQFGFVGLLKAAKVAAATGSIDGDLQHLDW
jgi:hypothetical protein